MSKRRRPISIEALAARFAAEYAPVNVHSLPRYRAHVRSILGVHVVPTLGRRRAASITAADVEAIRDDVAGARSASRVVSVLGVLSMMFRWAMRQRLVARNPCDGVQRPRVAHATDFYTADEIERIERALRKAEPLLRAMVLVALYTGLRKGELLGLRWRDVDQRGKRLDVHRSYAGRTKGGKPRHLPLHAQAAAALAAWRPLCPAIEDLVFPVRRGVGELRQGNSCDMVGLPELLARVKVRAFAHPWHALRHSFASHFVMRGGNLRALQQLLGHAHLNTTERYAHLAPDFLVAEMARLEFSDAKRPADGGKPSTGPRSKVT